MDTNILSEFNLKPLFVFKLNTEPQYFGAFAGQKDKDKEFPKTLTWDIPKGTEWSETSLWILPLTRSNGLYSLDFNSKFQFKEKKTVKIQNCEIGIFNQSSDLENWADYKNLKQTEINFDLNFESRQFSVSKEAVPFTITQDNQEISGWFFGTSTIDIRETLLKFEGLECDIVDSPGRKNDFHIWCGMRVTSGKIFLSINNSDQDDETPGNDCPLVWSHKGFLDDTIFSTYKNENERNGTFKLENGELGLGYKGKNRFLSKALAYIDYNAIVKPDKFYSWFIQENKNLFPFFKIVKKDEITKTLDRFIKRGGNNLLYFFQINRFSAGQNVKSILTWIAGGLEVLEVNKCIGNVAAARVQVDKAGVESISPTFKNLEFDNLKQIVLEHSITNMQVSFVGAAIFANPPVSVEKITQLEFDSKNKKLEIHLSNIRKNDFERQQLFSGKPQIIINNLTFSTDKIGRESDNGTLFGFKIFTSKDVLSGIKGGLNDGTFAFGLEERGKIETKFYFSLQLQKAQKPLYIWEYYQKIEDGDTIVPCYTIEDFKLPVNSVTPLSTDLSDQERFIVDDDRISIASTGALRPEQPLIIPISKKDKQKYWLSFSENINVGQDFFFATELLSSPEDKGDQSVLDIVVVGNEPQTAVKVQTPFGTSPKYDNGKWVIARKNSLSADGNVWEILNEKANDEGITLTFPPQVIGEAFRKTNKGELFHEEPDGEKLVDFKFSPPAVINIANEQLNRQMVTAPWNLRNLFGTYGDSNPGLRLLTAQFELLYGMSAHFENRDAFIAELENKLGQMVKAPRGAITWEHNGPQSEAFKGAYAVFFQILKLYVSRLAIYEVSASKDKFQPAKFNSGVNYFFRIDENKWVEEHQRDRKLMNGKGAKLRFPFKNTPEYLKDIKDKYHKDDAVEEGKPVNPLSGGFHWGFESKAVYYELMTQGLQKGSSSGEIENLAFSSLGGYGKQVARFANDKTIIKSTTSMGRTHFYAVERIGRIGVFWNKAKHVIEYERTVVPSEQFEGTGNEGRIIVRKVREFIEILEPERKYPEFGGESYAAGSVMGTHFKSIKIPVNSTWGRDLTHTIGNEEKPFGWEVPLWNKDAKSSVYPFPQIMLNVMAAKESGQAEVLCNIENPENIYFYTDVREHVAEKEITAETNDWPSIAGVDFTFQPFTNIYVQAPPCLDYNDPKLVNAPLPSPVEVLPGFERFTFKVLPSDMPVSANGAYNDKSTISAKLRTVTMQRKTIAAAEKSIEDRYKADKFLEESNKILVKNFNGYKGLLSAGRQQDINNLKNHLKSGVKEHIISFFQKNETNIDMVSKILEQAKAAPALRYLSQYTASDGRKYSDFYSDISTKDTGTSEDILWELSTIMLWNQLVSMLEATISTVDKHYTLMFDTLKTELHKYIDEFKDDDLKGKVKKEVEELKSKIISAEKFIDLHLGFMEKFFTDENKGVNDNLNAFEQELDKIAVQINQSIIEIEDDVKDLSDTLSIPELKTKAKEISASKINELLKLVENQIDALSIHQKVKEEAKRKLKGYTDVSLIKLIKDKVEEIPGTSPVDELKDSIIAVLNGLKSHINNEIDQVKKLPEELQKELAVIESEIKGIKEDIEDSIKQLKTGIDGWIGDQSKGLIQILDSLENDKVKIKEACDVNFFNKKDEIIQVLSKGLIDLLINKYKETDLTFPPVAHVFNKVDAWMKDIIADFNALLHKINSNLSNDLSNIQSVVDKYLDPALDLYNEYKAIEDAIGSGDKDKLIQEANKLSQAINQDFGHAAGKVTEAYYQLENVQNSVGDLGKELQNTLFNYRSVMEDIKAVDLGINRKTVELIYNFKESYAPKLLMTPVMGKLEKLNDSLSAVGVNIPYGALEEKFIAPMKEWGSSFAKSFSNQFPMSNLLKDIGGFKFDNLLPFLKGDDAFFKAVKVESKVDEKAMKAWVKADLDYTFTDDNTLMSIGPLKVRMLRNAKIEAHAYESIDIDRHRKSDSFGTLKSTFEISLSGAPLMLFKETVVSFKNGKYDFDLDPSRMEMPGLLKLLTDASKNIPASDPSAAGEEKKSPFKMQILKYAVPNTKLEIPMGVEATLDLPPLSVGGGPTAISNLTFGGHFRLKALNTDVTPAKLDFNMGLGFYLGKRDLPFNFTAFILGGGGFIDCSFSYHPSVSKKPVVTFIMSVHGSAALTIAAGWITGSIMVLAGIEVEYYSDKGSTRIEMFVAIIGVVDILGLISVYLSLRLSINYQSDAVGTVLYGVGRVKVKIRICRFVTISVSKDYTMVLKGKSESVKNENSQKIATSLN